ncbi:MAG: type II toxin-antitoxin system VapC family toxin [Proteobacteria bacterium]|nr:type II toxin-antitoxin system VapC family toxin [Pseudomonadota bacterium]
MSRLLLDTHVLLWALVSPSRLSRKVRELLRDPATAVVVSAASAWEISTKHRLGKLHEAHAVVESYRDHLRYFQADELAITSAHALAAGSFSQAHRDPFDRMLAAQSLLEGLPLVTDDEVFKLFPVAIVW